MSTANALDQFLGPLEALIADVQERKVDLFDIDLTALARDFKKDGEIKLIEGAKFIAGLAHLMYLKAVKLLPVEEEKQEETGFELTSELFLEEYTGFKQVAHIFSIKEKEQSFLFPRKPLFEIIEPLKPVLGPPISLEQFSKLFAEILEQAQKRNVTISEDLYKLCDVLDDLRERLRGKKLRFSDLFRFELGKPLLIVTFLAVLELMKNQEARLFMEKHEYILEKTA